LAYFSFGGRFVLMMTLYKPLLF